LPVTLSAHVLKRCEGLPYLDSRSKVVYSGGKNALFLKEFVFHHWISTVQELVLCRLNQQAEIALAWFPNSEE
jgi:hypothetical protein